MIRQMNMRGLVGTTLHRFLRRGYFTYFHLLARPEAPSLDPRR